MVVNILNPNAWLYWSVAAGPILAAAWRASPARALAFVAGFYLLLLGGNVLVVLLAGRAARAGPGLARALGVVSGAALVALGAWRIASELLGA
jgi:threonine/homoserine/homoserine lactone efflux protein